MNTVKPVTFSKRSRARMTLQSKTSVSTLQYVVAKGGRQPFTRESCRDPQESPTHSRHGPKDPSSAAPPVS